MLLSEIQDMVRFLTKEPTPSSPTFATNARILTFANFAQNEIASRTKCYMSSNVPNSTGQPTLNTVAGQYMYAMPTDCLEIVEMKISVWRVQRKTMDFINAQTGYQQWTYPGIPLYYWMQKQATTDFGIWYTPQAIYPIALWYIRKPTAMVNQSDSPDLDRRLDMAVVYYTCEKIMESRREMNYKSGYWLKSYEGEIKKYNDTADQAMAPVDFMGETPCTSD